MDLGAPHWTVTLSFHRLDSLEILPNKHFARATFRSCSLPAIVPTTIVRVRDDLLLVALRSERPAADEDCNCLANAVQIFNWKTGKSIAGIKVNELGTLLDAEIIADNLVLVARSVANAPQREMLPIARPVLELHSIDREAGSATKVASFRFPVQQPEISVTAMKLAVSRVSLDNLLSGDRLVDGRGIVHVGMTLMNAQETEMLRATNVGGCIDIQALISRAEKSGQQVFAWSQWRDCFHWLRDSPRPSSSAICGQRMVIYRSASTPAAASATPTVEIVNFGPRAHHRKQDKSTKERSSDHARPDEAGLDHQSSLLLETFPCDNLETIFSESSQATLPAILRSITSDGFSVVDGSASAVTALLSRREIWLQQVSHRICLAKK